MGPTSGHDEQRDRLPIRIGIWIAALGSCLATILTVAACGARWSSLCELTAHWPVQIAIATALACLVFLLARKRKLALLAGTIALVNAAYVAPIFLPRRHGPVAGPECRVVSANIRTSNRDSGRFLEFIRSEGPDVILVMEVDDRWQRALEDLKRDYPFSVAQPRADNFGITLLSRHPISSHRVESLDDSGVPTIIATIDFHGRPLNVVGTHPLPPVGHRHWQLRNRHLRALGELVAQLARPVIVLGDLNTTPWSPRFGELVRNGGLQDSRQGFGVQPTWPNKPWGLRIPIDHVLLSDDLIVTHRHVGPDIGSDHLPIVIAFASDGS